MSMPEYKISAPTHDEESHVEQKQRMDQNTLHGLDGDLATGRWNR